MKFLFLILASGILPLSSFADEATLSSFISATVGNWSGKGTVIFQGLGSTDGKYSIKVEQSVTPEKPGYWSSTTTMTGMPGSSAPTTTIEEVSASGLKIAATQFETSAEISKSTDQELDYTLVHVDSTTGNTVTTTRTMTLNPDGSMHVYAEIYQNGSLIEDFDYTLNKSQEPVTTLK